MLKAKINLPHAYRLSLSLVKTRGVPSLPTKEFAFIPTLSALRRFRYGNRFSHIFRHIFEHKKINRILGTNLAMAFVATSLISNQTSLNLFNAKSVWEDDSSVIRNEKVLLTTEKGVRYPLDNSIKINQGYSFFHRGVDLHGLLGDPVYPFMPGTVLSIQYSWVGYGNAIIIDHGDNTSSLYAHLSKITIEMGDGVTTKTKIGEVGAVGHATGPHLHFEIRENDTPINPLPFLPKEDNVLTLNQQ